MLISLRNVSYLIEIIRLIILFFISNFEPSKALNKLKIVPQNCPQNLSENCCYTARQNRRDRTINPQKLAVIVAPHYDAASDCNSRGEISK